MDSPPPRRGRGRPRRGQVDEETASAPHNPPPPPPKPQSPPGFQVPPMPQPGFFPPMTSEAYQAYMNFWYTQSQVQMPARQMPYSVPPPPQTAHAQPFVQPVVKLSKLVKEARLLGCQTFSRTADAIVAKNWIKKVSNTMIDMELDDTHKLRVATRLLDHYTHFHRDQKRQEFFRLKQWGKTVVEYEIELRQLAEFVPEMCRSEEYLCSKFEEGLNLEI